MSLDLTRLDQDRFQEDLASATPKEFELALVLQRLAFEGRVPPVVSETPAPLYLRQAIVYSRNDRLRGQLERAMREARPSGYWYGPSGPRW